MRRANRLLHPRMMLFASIFLMMLLLFRNAFVVVDLPPSSPDGLHDKNLKNFVQPVVGKVETSNTTLLPNDPLWRGKESKKELPSFENGGLVFFLHIPKTGGSTIRSSFDQMKGVQYIFVSGNGIYENALPIIWKYVKSTSKQRRDIMFLEIHGRDSPNLIVLRDTLLQWKRIAKKHGLPVFFFTVVREPLAHALSYFNFFHVQRKSPYFDQVEANESNLLRYSLHDPQCQFLARGEFSLREKTKQQPSREECRSVHEALLGTMDWVGTTERMDSETLPILKHIFNLGGFRFQKQRVSSKAANLSISIQELSEQAVSSLNELNKMDINLYEGLQSEFLFSMWREYAAAPIYQE